MAMMNPGCEVPILYNNVGLLKSCVRIPPSYLEMVTNIFDYPEYKVAIFLLQGLSAVFGFILAPWFYLRFIEKKRLRALSPNAQIELLPVILALLIMTRPRFRKTLPIRLSPRCLFLRLPALMIPISLGRN